MKTLIHLIIFVLLATSHASSQVSDYVPTDGLVAWWPFNGNANDASGNGHDGTVNGATLTLDRFGAADMAYNFNGTTDQIYGLCTGFPMTARSISLWYRANNVGPWTSDGLGVFGYGGGICGTSWLQVVTDSSLAIGMHCNNNRSDAGGILVDTLWHHWVMSTDGMSITSFYVDGSLVNDTANFYDNTNVADKEFIIGGVPGPNGIGLFTDAVVKPFEGDVDAVGLWSRVLTPCEVIDLFNETVFGVSLQPIGVNGLDGTTVNFVVGASTEACLTYQWQQDCGSGFADLADSGSYSGAQSDTLMIAPAILAMDGCAYRCVLSACALCTDTSEAATLNVISTSVIEGGSPAVLRLYPNPTKDKVTIALPENASPAMDFQICDALGRMLEHVRPGNSGTLTISVADLSAGAYFVRLQGEQWQAHGRFIKE